MISRCNGVRANNSCREFLVLEPVLRKLSIGTKVQRAKELLRSREGPVPTHSIGTRLKLSGL